MKTRSIIWLAAASALVLVAGNAVAQQKDAKSPPTSQSDSADGKGDAQSDARKRADAEAAKQRRAERKANAPRTGDGREAEEEKPQN